MKVETKYNKGDRVWFMKNNKPNEMVISYIEIHFGTCAGLIIKYNGQDTVNGKTWIDNTNIFEKDLYESKQELLNSL